MRAGARAAREDSPASWLSRTSSSRPFRSSVFLHKAEHNSKASLAFKQYHVSSKYIRFTGGNMLNLIFPRVTKQLCWFHSGSVKPPVPATGEWWREVGFRSGRPRTSREWSPSGVPRGPAELLREEQKGVSCKEQRPEYSMRVRGGQYSRRGKGGGSVPRGGVIASPWLRFCDFETQIQPSTPPSHPAPSPAKPGDPAFTNK